MSICSLTWEVYLDLPPLLAQLAVPRFNCNSAYVCNSDDLRLAAPMTRPQCLVYPRASLKHPLKAR